MSKAEREHRRKLRFDDSHNVRQALISVGSGGLTGKGWRQGTQNALGYLPRAVAHNDFIFSVIAEEKGFVGSLIVLTLYGTVLLTGIRTAGQARDQIDLGSFADDLLDRDARDAVEEAAAGRDHP